MSRIVMAVVVAVLAVTCTRADEAEDKMAAFLQNPRSLLRATVTRDNDKPGKPVIKVASVINLGPRSIFEKELLSAFKSLKVLDLSSLDAEREDGEKALKVLAKLTTLQELVLPECASMKDPGLMELAALKNLTSLSIPTRTNLTKEGIAALQKALPKCKIVRQ